MASSSLLSDMYKDAARSRILSIENRINQIESQITVLNRPLERARIAYKRIQNRLLRVSSLPSELLSIIFEMGRALASSNPREIPFEIRVSQVSHHWRNVALGTSRLWTRIILGTSIDMATTYFQRSAVSALHLSIDINKERLTLDGVTYLGDLVSLHADRLLDMDVVSNWRQGFDVFLNCLPSVAPFLRRLTIAHMHGFDDESNIFPRIFIDSAPNLTTVLLRSITSLHCIPPLTNVTHLRIDEHPLTSFEFRSLLTGPSTLTHLVINDCAIYTMVGTIELPSLRTLHIGDSNSYCIIPRLLTIISAPSLEDLSLATLLPAEVEEIAGLMPMGASVPKYPLLRFLTILPHSDKMYFFSPSTWRLVIRIFPTVTELILSYDEFHIFLESLDLPAHTLNPLDTSSLWPQLHTLTLFGHLPHFSLPLIHNALLARIALGHPIRKLRFSHPTSFISIDDLRWLRAHLELEECTMHMELARGSSIISWLSGN